jgi:hypothetical protein
VNFLPLVLGGFGARKKDKKRESRDRRKANETFYRVEKLFL